MRRRSISCSGKNAVLMVLTLFVGCGGDGGSKENISSAPAVNPPTSAAHPQDAQEPADVYQINNSHFLYQLPQYSYSVSYHFYENKTYVSVAARAKNPSVIQAMMVKGTFHVDGIKIVLIPQKSTCPSKRSNGTLKIADRDAIVLTSGVLNLAFRRTGPIPNYGSGIVTTGCLFEDLRFTPGEWADL
jgi:hypothetical protein